ncbi:MAG: tRNA 2-thiouridine(34) synthase MnmA [Chlorobi bacterium]|nr:tRNA 2-thiouridine(34) synthase MnmA [Chlorobiota bacterium]
MTKKKVLVGMSGGVDSSAAAAMLIDQGYDVTGVTIEPFYFEEYYGDEYKDHYATGIRDAKIVCDKLGIPHLTVDYKDYFREKVVSYFIDEYMAGRTPNPCIFCNPLIKWGKLISTADEQGINFVATGHYAKINKEEQTGRYFITKGGDINKDQSYFLWKLDQSRLARTIFPLGDYAKPDVRKIAEDHDLPVFNKAESQEVCFIPDSDYRRFLRLAVPDIDKKIGEGNIELNGEVLGQHKGYPFYTIGQRKGMGISYKDPLYINSIDAKTNTIIVGENRELEAKEVIADTLNFMKYNEFDPNKKYIVKIRYRDPGTAAVCSLDADGTLHIRFDENVRAVTPGQSVVIYDGSDVVAGGIIQTAANKNVQPRRSV